MSRKTVGGFLFETHKTDHPPLHVHILNAKEERVGRWNIEKQEPLDSFILTKRLRKALHDAGYMK